MSFEGRPRPPGFATTLRCVQPGGVPGLPTGFKVRPGSWKVGEFFLSLLRLVKRTVMTHDDTENGKQR